MAVRFATVTTALLDARTTPLEPRPSAAYRGRMALASQQRSLLARRLLIALATPVVLLVALGVVLGRQIVQMSEDAQWVDHSDHVLAIANDTLLQAVNQETGARGYFLAADRVFLEPLERAHPRDGFARLHDLTSDNKPQQARFDQADHRYEEWFAAESSAIADPDPEHAKTPAALRDRKAQMDAVREAMRQAVDGENVLRRERVAASASSTAATKIVFLALFAAAAAALSVLSWRQLRAIASAFSEALDAEAEAREATAGEVWIRAGHAKLVEAVQGERSVEQLGAEALATVAAYAHADIGAFFTKDAGTWKRSAGYALDSRATGGSETFEEGEGLVGRAAVEQKLLHLTGVSPDFLKLRSGTGETSPVEIVVLPASVDGQTNAVLELGFLHPVEARTVEMIGRLGESLALAVRSSEYKQQLRGLLEESQRQAEELQTQQEELRVSNEELEAQATALKTMQNQLETQQAELEQTNDNLTQQAQLLERQNQQLAESQVEVAAKAREVERASAFKSEFLSNMSHELRTPLNSSLILAKLLGENRDGNLSHEQVRFAQTIYAAGNDLLVLINDILDLSKIEAGKMEVHPNAVSLESVRSSLLRTFEPVAHEKGLRLAVTLATSAPTTFETDAQRLEQILKNLLSNAMKFTDRGGEVGVEVAASADRLTFAVRDTGVGIPSEQQGIIFEAFRQADGTTNRKYGGTGLGLSISRDLARLLGGDISITSEAGKGSTFVLSLPRTYAGPIVAAPPPTPAIPRARSAAAPARVEATEPEPIDDDVVEPGRRIVLVVEDDASFAKIVEDVAREAGFQSLLATTAERGFRLAKKHAPIGIVLDMNLPDHTGLSMLDRLKREPSTRHIPVHVVSASDYTETALSMGAAAYLLKPVTRDQLVEAIGALEARSRGGMRRVLVVEDDAELRESVATLLGRNDVQISAAATVAEALALLREHTFDCVVTDLGLPDQSGYDLLERMATEEPYSVPPVIVYTGRELSADEEQRLRRYSKSVIVKGARSPERLLDEVTLFLHQVEAELPAEQQRTLKKARHREAVFDGRTVLVVEDDVRNLFALTSVLEPKGARVVIARNGKEALAAMEKASQIDLVLMDIMMPEMDGLEATREIRKNPKWVRVPIIALTAKAMKDDQERCLAAGANDYLAKPLDVEMLLSLLRVWMPKH
jgi:CheY-like chemotaxis protein/signal transduction histidine kinase/CHASE3 domain sensor protein